MMGITEVSLSDFNEQTARTNFGIGKIIEACHEKNNKKKRTGSSRTRRAKL